MDPYEAWFWMFWSWSGGGHIFRLLCSIYVYFLCGGLFLAPFLSAIVWGGPQCRRKRVEWFPVVVGPCAGVVCGWDKATSRDIANSTYCQIFHTNLEQNVWFQDMVCGHIIYEYLLWWYLKQIESIHTQRKNSEETCIFKCPVYQENRWIV
jgi:hypothetical protein